MSGVSALATCGGCCSVQCCLDLPVIGWCVRRCCIDEDYSSSPSTGGYVRHSVGTMGGAARTAKNISMNSIVTAETAAMASTGGVGGAVIASQTLAAKDGEEMTPLRRTRSVSFAPSKMNAPLPGPPMTTPRSILRRQSVLLKPEDTDLL